MAVDVIQTPNSPLPIGPYSQGIKAGNLVFVAGQVGIDPATGKMVGGGIQDETRRALENIEGILAAAGATPENVLATTVHMVKLDDFVAMNEVYVTYFKNNPPVRTTVGVSSLPGGAAIEITAIAYVGG